MPANGEENAAVELDEPINDENPSVGYFLQDESEVFRPSVDPNEEISDNDFDVLNDPDMQTALAAFRFLCSVFAG